MSDEFAADKAKEAGARDAARLWRAWGTLHEMVRDRGYELADEEINISLQDFIEKFESTDGLVDRTKLKFSARPTQEMRVRYSTSADPAKFNSESSEIGTIWVEFSNESNIGIKQMRSFVQYCLDQKFHTGILVTNVNVTSAALKLVPAAAHEVRVECFLEQELLVNITHHELVPKHTLLSKEEKVKLLQRYRLKETQLPRIQLKDPVARYLGLRLGQVVKIVRRSETAGRYASYRLCVASRG